MPPDSSPSHSAIPRGRVVEVIERSQEDALHQLRQAGVPETQALLVMHRIHPVVTEPIKASTY